MSDLNETIKKSVCETIEDIGNKLNDLFDDIITELEIKFTHPPDLPTEEQSGYISGIKYSQDVNRKFMGKMIQMFGEKFLEKPPSENHPERKAQ